MCGDFFHYVLIVFPSLKTRMRQGRQVGGASIIQIIMLTYS